MCHCWTLHTLTWRALPSSCTRFAISFFKSLESRTFWHRLEIWIWLCFVMPVIVQSYNCWQWCLLQSSFCRSTAWFWVDGIWYPWPSMTSVISSASRRSYCIFCPSTFRFSSLDVCHIRVPCLFYALALLLCYPPTSNMIAMMGHLVVWLAFRWSNHWHF